MLRLYHLAKAKLRTKPEISQERSRVLCGRSSRKQVLQGSDHHCHWSSNDSPQTASTTMGWNQTVGRAPSPCRPPPRPAASATASLACSHSASRLLPSSAASPPRGPPWLPPSGAASSSSRTRCRWRQSPGWRVDSGWSRGWTQVHLTYVIIGKVDWARSLSTRVTLPSWSNCDFVALIITIISISKPMITWEWWEPPEGDGDHAWGGAVGQETWWGWLAQVAGVELCPASL